MSAMEHDPQSAPPLVFEHNVLSEVCTVTLGCPLLKSWPVANTVWADGEAVLRIKLSDRPTISAICFCSKLCFSNNNLKIRHAGPPNRSRTTASNCLIRNRQDYVHPRKCGKHRSIAPLSRESYQGSAKSRRCTFSVCCLRCPSSVQTGVSKGRSEEWSNIHAKKLPRLMNSFEKNRISIFPECRPETTLKFSTEVNGSIDLLRSIEQEPHHLLCAHVTEKSLASPIQGKDP